MISNAKLISAIALLASCTSVFASPHESGAYIEGNIGTLYESVDILGIQASAFGSLGLNANLGYQFNRYLAAEAGYTAYGIGETGGIVNGVDAAAKFILPFQIGESDFSVFAKLGVADLFKGGDNSVTPLAGIGAAYAITPNLDLNVQAQGVTEGFFSLGLLSTGLTYHFN